MGIPLSSLPEHVRKRIEGDKPKAKVQSHTPGVMNKWERAYADELDILTQTGHIRTWWFESVKFRLAEGCWYTPDFLVMRAGGEYELHEVKGHWKDDALVKCKVMAESFPFPLVVVKRGEGGHGWKLERVKTRQGGK